MGVATRAKTAAGAVPSRQPAREHVAAIHVLRGKLGLSDEDYRALLLSLVGKSSTLEMTDAQRLKVRDSMQRLVPGAPGARSFDARYKRATPKERKAWALWHELRRKGCIADSSSAALGKWVQRNVGVQALAWCTDAQLVQVIEQLKRWLERGGAEVV